MSIEQPLENNIIELKGIWVKKRRFYSYAKTVVAKKRTLSMNRTSQIRKKLKCRLTTEKERVTLLCSDTRMNKYQVSCVYYMITMNLQKPNLHTSCSLEKSLSDKSLMIANTDII